MRNVAAEVTLGSQRYGAHAARVWVSLGLLPSVNAFTASFAPRTAFSAAPGDDAVLRLDGGDGAVDVLSGTIALVRRGLCSIDVTGADAGRRLGAVRPARTFEKQAAGQIVRTLLSDAGAGAGTIAIDLPLAFYVAHQARTSAEHVASLAAMAGCMASVQADGRVAVLAAPTRPDTALRFGRELIAYGSTAAPAPRADTLCIGNGQAGSIQAPNVLQPTFQRLPGSAAAPGPDARWHPSAMLHTAAAAAGASDAAAARAGAATRRVRATCMLLPSLRPGMVADVQDLPDGPSGGPWLIERVQHHVHPSTGAVTTFDGVVADGGSLLGGAIGAGIAAVGGLL